MRTDGEAFLNILKWNENDSAKSEVRVSDVLVICFKWDKMKCLIAFQHDKHEQIIISAPMEPKWNLENKSRDALTWFMTLLRHQVQVTRSLDECKSVHFEL